ncbi:hypothetical protein [Nesterenkonia sandarakina]|uniref:Uncharacterized protein n=1 Tax=Nesterenkonia sandarakina TaxID=272918 RepID=A0A7Z0EC01_9MICC|nr:hypothetical protein [Nesterenkonia sandarakina]NYJ18122.1 hypothetical protein [Nesterenkonia sandarakina]
MTREAAKVEAKKAGNCSFTYYLSDAEVEALATFRTDEPGDAEMTTTATHTAQTATAEAHGLPVGTVLVSSWGYGQTNIDFYEVTKATAKTVMIRPISLAKENGESWGTYTATPKRGEFTGDAFRCKVQDPHSQPWVKINSFAMARPIDEEAQHGTSYA